MPVRRLRRTERRGWRRDGTFIDRGTIARCFRLQPDRTWPILPISADIDAGSLLDSGPQNPEYGPGSAKTRMSTTHLSWSETWPTGLTSGDPAA